MQEPTPAKALAQIPLNREMHSFIYSLGKGYLGADEFSSEINNTKAETLYDVYLLSKQLIRSRHIRRKILGRSYMLHVMRMAAGKESALAQAKKDKKQKKEPAISPEKLFRKPAKEAKLAKESVPPAELKKVTLKVLSKNFSEKEFQSFVELTRSAGKKVCREVDLPYGEEEIEDWKTEVKNGNRTIIVAMHENKPVGTLSIVPGSLPVVRIKNGELDDKVSAIAGYDITAEFVLPEYRRRGICRRMEERADEIVTEKAAQGEMVYKSISTGMRAYEIMDSVLSDLMKMPKEEIENTPTVILFKMYASLDGKKLSEEHLKKMRYVIDKIDINPSATAIRVLLDEKVKSGKAEFIGHSVDGAEPVYIIKG
ncbi:MAG: GNAT family N-acetyltransferase [Candidatus Micrarchaeota archaeon]|nr:GNAT family N-acetyltransferase [Candidatus Micrarchaeota archaeon]